MRFRSLTMRDLFDFEQDGRYPLRRIPMIVRLKLDAAGVKLPLIGWALLSREQREALVDMPCSSDEEIEAYRQTIAKMLLPHADNPDAALELIPVPAMPAWRNVATVPEQVCLQLAELSLPVPDLQRWRGLSDLQRFALIKLTRNRHKNANLHAALREFGLA